MSRNVLESLVNMNQRSSLLSLTEDGVRMTAFEGMQPVTTESGKVDRGATASAMAQHAGDFFVEAVTPDKAAILGTVGLVAGGKTLSLGGMAAGGIFGLIGDALEAIPAVAVGLTYLGGAAVYKIGDLFD